MSVSAHSAQLELMGYKAPPRFDGFTYRRDFDEARLKSLLQRVFLCLLDGNWRTLAQLKTECGGSEAGISARLRDLRKARFGGFTINARRRLLTVVGGREVTGLWEYRLATGLLRREQVEAIFNRPKKEAF